METNTQKFEKTTSIIYINKFFYLYYISVCVLFSLFFFLNFYFVCKRKKLFNKKNNNKKYINIYINKLDYSNIEFPVSVKQYNKIEKQNNITFYVVYKLRLWTFQIIRSH